MAFEKTLSPLNMWRTICPIFGAEVELRACLALREKVWRGERTPIRQGCQACMRASKCPIVPMMQSMMREKGDPYYSAEPKLGHLAADLIKRIANVVVPKQILELFDIPARQVELIQETNCALGAKKLKGVIDLEPVEFTSPSDAPANHREKPHRHKAEKVEASVVEETDAIVTAAITGDLSAAINAAL